MCYELIQKQCVTVLTEGAELVTGGTKFGSGTDDRHSEHAYFSITTVCVDTVRCHLSLCMNTAAQRRQSQEAPNLIILLMKAHRSKSSVVQRTRLAVARFTVVPLHLVIGSPSSVSLPADAISSLDDDDGNDDGDARAQPPRLRLRNSIACASSPSAISPYSVIPCYLAFATFVVGSVY